MVIFITYNMYMLITYELKKITVIPIYSCFMAEKAVCYLVLLQQIVHLHKSWYSDIVPLHNRTEARYHYTLTYEDANSQTCRLLKQAQNNRGPLHGARTELEHISIVNFIILFK